MRFRVTLRIALQDGGPFAAAAAPNEAASHETTHMKVLNANEVDRGRGHQAIGSICAVASWRGAISPITDADRLALVPKLIREAEQYDADAIVELQFDVESVRSADVDAAPLQRVIATGVAIRYAEAA